MCTLQISNFIKESSIVSANIKNSVQLSAAVKSDPIYARNYYYQDWIKWLNNGWLDFAVPMNYNKDSEQFVNVVEKIKKMVPKDKIWMGIGVYNQNRYDAMTKTILTLH